MRTRSGCLIVRLLHAQHTDNPSIQGVWNPFTNKTQKLAVTEFPIKEFQNPIDYVPTATEKIVEIYSKQKSTETTSSAENISKPV